MPTLVFVLLLLFSFLDVLLLFFFIRRSKEPRPSRLLLAAVLLLALTVARAPFLGLFSFTFFGLIYLAYLDLVLVTPIAAALLLLSFKRGQINLTKKSRLALLSLVVALPLVGFYASWIETRRTQLEMASFALPGERTGKEPIKIGVFSDIQTYTITEHEREAARRLLAQEPDIIVIAGDLFQGSDEELQASLDGFRSFLNSLHAPGGVYFVEGDAEQWRRTPLLLEGTHVQYLYDEIKSITVKDRKISLLGLQLIYSSQGAQSAIYSLQNTPEEGDIRILLSHRPDSVLSLPNSSRIDLVISGHTHGGQVQLPLIGPLFTLTDVPRNVAAGGAHKINGNAIYVSRGLGFERKQAPPIRFLCPPEVAIVTIQ